jgi:hypothetical protein
MFSPFILLSLLSFTSSECQIQINSSVPSNNQQLQVDEEFEITPEWLQLCLEKNKLEELLFKNYKYLKSVEDNPNFCVVHNHAHKNHIITWYEEHQEVIKNMDILKAKLIANKNHVDTNENSDNKESTITDLSQFKIYNTFPYKPIFDFPNQEQNKQQILSEVQKQKNKKSSLNQQNKNYYYIAVNHSQNGRYEDAIIALKKITKDYAEYKKVISYMAMNKRKFSYQIASEKRRNYILATRENFANRLERAFLEQNMDTTISVSGENNEILTINYIFAGRVFAHNFNKSSMSQVVKDAGFKEVVFENDYSDDIWRTRY